MKKILKCEVFLPIIQQPALESCRLFSRLSFLWSSVTCRALRMRLSQVDALVRSQRRSDWLNKHVHSWNLRHFSLLTRSGTCCKCCDSGIYTVIVLASSRSARVWTWKRFLLFSFSTRIYAPGCSISCVWQERQMGCCFHPGTFQRCLLFLARNSLENMSYEAFRIRSNQHAEKTITIRVE